MTIRRAGGFWFALTTSLVTLFLTVPIAQTLRDENVDAEVKVFWRQVREAIGRKDGATLERLLADDFMFIHSTGSVETKQSFIQAELDGSSRLQQNILEVSGETIRSYDGRVALLYGVGAFLSRSDNSGLARTRSVSVFVKVGGQWRWVSGQSTRLPIRPKVTATVAPKLYDEYVGRYAVDSARVLTVTKEDGELRGHVTGRPKLELLPKSAREFMRFSEDNVWTDEIVFVRDSNGLVSEAVLRDSEGKEVWRAKRLQ